MKKFVLVNGYVSIDNAQLYIDINTLKKDIKDRGGWLGIFFTFIGISVFNNFKNEHYFENIFHYIDFGLRILGALVIIAILWFLLFKRKSKKKLIISDIRLIEIDESEFETEVTIQFSSRREIDINFRNLENQLEPFLETIKKRNSRIELKYL